MKFITQLIFLVSLFCAVTAMALSSQVTTKRQALIDLQTKLSEFRTHYGLVKDKEHDFGVTLDGLEKKYSQLIEEGKSLEGWNIANPDGTLSAEEVQQLFVGLAAEFKDGHSNIKRNSSSGWTVGLKTADIEGKLIVVGVDPNFFIDKNLTDLVGVGDEVVEVDGRPVEELAKENMLYAQIATYDARKMWGLEHILEVPSGFLRSKKDNQQVRVKIKKFQTGQMVTGYFNWTNVKDFNRLRTGAEKTDRYYFGNTGTTESYFSIGLKYMKLPEGSILDIGTLVNAEIKKELAQVNATLAKVGVATVSKDTPYLKPITRLKVYSVSFNGLRIGVIRIPNYSPEGGFKDVLAELAFLKRAIPFLNMHTDMVIIDQNSNNGGYVDYVTQLVKLFAHEQEIPSITADIKLTSSYMQAMEGGAKELAGKGQASQAASHPELPNFAQIAISDWERKRLETKLQNGEEWTGPLPYMSTVENINEGEPGLIVSGGEVTYAGKVMILNDRRSASGGDFFPTIMRKVRALVFGTTSRGLGAPVYRSVESVGSQQMFMRCPYASCRDAEGKQFENVGRVPDVERDVTLGDLVRGFAPYSHDVLVSAVLFYQGKTPEEMTEYVHRQSLRPVAVNEATATLDEKLVELFQIAQTGSVADVTKAYEDVQKIVASLADKVPAEEWERLQIPVPKVLYSKDVILESIHKRDAVLSRLSEMAELPRYKNDAELSKLIAAVTELSTTLPQSGSFLTPCAIKLNNVRMPRRPILKAKPS